jgi:hypothetical protein
MVRKTLKEHFRTISEYEVVSYLSGASFYRSKRDCHHKDEYSDGTGDNN